MIEPSPTPASAPDAPPVDEARELRVALWLTLVVLCTLTLAKAIGSIPVVGTIGFTLAAVIQLYLPMWRADELSQPLAYVGLHLDAWRADLKNVLVLMAVTFPPYAIGHHLYMTRAHDWLVAAGLVELARWVPQATLAPHLPTTLVAWGAGLMWFGQMAATHVLGVALPEETFYRGYLQPRLEHRWPARLRVLGTAVGRAAVLACALFALGHFLGEWNPLRLGPFFPALIFAWLRNASGSVAGAVGYHAACNILGELLYALYDRA